MTLSEEKIYILVLTIFQELKLKAEIGRRIKKIRVERGLTQKEIASKVGIDFTYIGKIERGEQLPSLKILTKIGDALSIPVNYFFQDEAAATINEISSELKYFAKDEKGREFLRALTQLHKDDIPLMVEITKVLNKHRIDSHKKPYETSNEMYLKAAEEEANYGKDKT